MHKTMSSYYGPSGGGGGRDDRRRDDYNRRGGGDGRRDDYRSYGRRDDRDRDRRDYDRDRDRDNRDRDSRDSYRGGGGGGRDDYRGSSGGGYDRDRGGSGGYRGGGDDYRSSSGGGHGRRDDRYDRDRGGHGGGGGGYDDRGRGNDRGRGDDRYGGGGGSDRYGGGGGGGSDRYGGGGGGGSDRYGGGDDRVRSDDRSRGDDRYGGGGGRSSSYSGGGGGSGRDYSGGGGRGGGGRDFGGGGRGRGRGRGRGPQGPPPKEALSNLIPATVTANFRFYQYGLDGSSSGGKVIDSRRRKGELLNIGLFDEREGLLARNGMDAKDIENIRRVVFFEGSFMFTAKRIPFIDKFPFSLVGSRDGNQQGVDPNVPVMDNGDSMTITGVQAMCAPSIIAQEKTARDNEDALYVDRRCDGCPKAFENLESLMSHCQMTGHKPVVADDSAEPSNVELFTSFCNVALQRAMGERMARWGKEYIDPKNWTEPKDKQGRSLGVRIFRAYVSCTGVVVVW